MGMSEGAGELSGGIIISYAYGPKIVQHKLNYFAKLSYALQFHIFRNHD